MCGGGYSVMSYWIDVRQVCTPSPSPHATRQATNTNIKRHLRCTSRARSHVLGMQQPPDDFAGDVFGEPFSTCLHRLPQTCQRAIPSLSELSYLAGD